MFETVIILFNQFFFAIFHLKKILKSCYYGYIKKLMIKRIYAEIRSNETSFPLVIKLRKLLKYKTARF